MKIICIGNYPPRQCGIATFTENLVKAILKAASISANEIDIEVIAMNDGSNTYDYPLPVKHSINDMDSHAYRDMADYINDSGADVCLLQHEYGIYGGAAGVLLLGLLQRLELPLIVTCHTVLEKPGFHEKEVLKKIAAYASRIVVMNSLAIGFLQKTIELPLEKIAHIEHGVPDFEQEKDQLPPPPPEWNGRTVMLTFGLIGRSKGIETAIRALPELVKKHPELLYVVLGKTHPNVVKYAGEEYRNSLVQLVQTLGLEKHVQFIDRYVSEKELMACLHAADLYVTPYHNKAQITSGTLSYAVSGGCAVLSTPYWHAEELLGQGLGKLFDFGHSAQLANIIDQLLTHPERLEKLKNEAYSYGLKITWPKIGQAYIDEFKKLVAEGQRKSNIHSINKEPCAFYRLPDFEPVHLFRLTDGTGLLQHAYGSVPNYKTGYCLDDNARALVLSLMAYQQFREKKYLDVSTKYLSYLKYMQTGDGDFVNFLTYDHRFVELKKSDDAFGRAIWALGYLIRFAPNDSLFQVGLELFYTSSDLLRKLKYARGYANCIFGLYHYTRRFPDQEKYLHLLVELAEGLSNIYTRHRRPNWHWFEDSITYDNGLLPTSLYLAYACTGRVQFKKIADESTAFLESKCMDSDRLSLIGNKKWLGLDNTYEMFAQQPIDAMGMIMLYDTLYQLTKSEAVKQKLCTSFLWFYGHNDLGIPLFDSETGGCNDGIEAMGINRNQGAESCLAYLLSYLISRPYFC